MPTLAIYDVLKIQDFVFNSNKTKENCGASIIVQKVFEEGINNALDKNAIKNWKNAPYEFKMSSDDSINAEVIYIGGGNALVAFKDEKFAEELTQELSKFILNATGGMLQFSVAYCDFSWTDNYQGIKKELIKNLKINKTNKKYSYPILGIGLTRLASSDGLPAVERLSAGERNEADYVSKSAKLKIDAFRTSSNYFEEKLGIDYNFQTEFDKLGQKEGENYIAVVHIDGNNMGATLDKLINDSMDFIDAVPILREFSYTVDQKFIETLKIIAERLDLHLKKISLKDNKKQGKFPLRPIVLNGDDVTFVCAGRLGITLAEHFLHELSKKSPMILENTQKSVDVSACAGVAIVKSHFPFYRAYELAEELCKSAKEKGKIVAKNSGHKDKVGSWLDYHIVYSGVTTRLSELRSKAYDLLAQEVKPLTFPQNIPNPESSYQQYNLLWRPWCIIGDVDQKYQWQSLKNIHTQLKEKWTRSRLKTLRNTMIKSDLDVDSLLAHYSSRGYSLPEFYGSAKPFPSNNQTPYFDALELLDFHIELKEEEEEL